MSDKQCSGESPGGAVDRTRDPSEKEQDRANTRADVAAVAVAVAGISDDGNTAAAAAAMVADRRVAQDERGEPPLPARDGLVAPLQPPLREGCRVVRRGWGPS